jgi:hypothetical protein
VPNVQRGIGVLNLPALSSSQDPCNFLDQITAAMRQDVEGVRAAPACLASCLPSFEFGFFGA